MDHDIEYRSEILYTAFSRGLDDRNIVALHGTSLEVLTEIHKTGIQPGRTDYLGRGMKKQIESIVFVYPIKDRTSISGSEGQQVWEDALEWAQSYATTIARSHFLLREIFGPATPLKESKLIGRYGFIEEFAEEFVEGVPLFCQTKHAQVLLQYLRQNGYTDSAIQNLLGRMKSRKGVVFGYSNEVFNGYAEDGDDGKDVRVRSITIHKILGIEPLDDESYNFLDSMGK